MASRRRTVRLLGAGQQAGSGVGVGPVAGGRVSALVAVCGRCVNVDYMGVRPHIYHEALQ